MTRQIIFALILNGIPNICNALDLDIRSVRVSISEPQIFHSLLYKGSNSASPTINFELEPKNNERVGLFADINGIEIGYAIDIISNQQETETQDLILVYKKFQYTRLSINFQRLENFQTTAKNTIDNNSDTLFIENTKSTKYEINGTHNLHTFFGKSLFNHFFQIEPQLSDVYRASLSLISTWSYRELTLKHPNQLIFTPSFLDNEVNTLERIDSSSANASVGLLLSFNMKNNINSFIEGKVGRGYFNNRNDNEQLKRSGQETIESLGGGISWTSPNEKNLLIFRTWVQKGRHVKTSFGDLSLIYYF